MINELPVTPEALYEIVSLVPRAFWPDGVEYQPGGHDAVSMWTVDCDGLEIDDGNIAGEDWKGKESDPEGACALLPTQFAALAFMGSMLAGLSKLGSLEIYHRDGEELIVIVSDHGGLRSTSGLQSLLKTLARACM